MSDEPAFVRAILTDWGATLPRLVYADWLDERSDPVSLAKARFLRVWCELTDVPVNDLDGYTDRAEELERLKPGLDPEWLVLMEGNRFHVADPYVARLRAEAFLLRYSHLHAPRVGKVRVDSVTDAGNGDWRVRCAAVHAATLHPGEGWVPPLEVERATGRVHMIDYRGRRYLSHHPPPA